MKKKGIPIFLVMCVILTVLLMVALFPVLLPARSSANEAKCLDQLRTVAKTLSVYKQEAGKLPDSLGELAAMGVSSNLLVCRANTSVFYVYTPKSTEMVLWCPIHTNSDTGRPFFIDRDLQVHAYVR